MNDRLTNEEREAAELALLAGWLGHPSAWAEPTPGLEDAVVQAVVNAPAPADTAASSAVDAARRSRKPRRRRFTLSAVGVAAAVAIVLGSVVEAGRGTRADFTARLSATGLAPRARASADVTRNKAGFRIVLDADGLPSLRDHEYYQAWLRNARGTLVPIGTFSSSDGRITLWSGVSPKDFPAISVTIESPDNEQPSSGRRVLTGELRPG
jgi:hypothetical protein